MPYIKTMTNQITVQLRNGTNLSFSVATDSRIKTVDMVARILVCKSRKVAEELNGELRAWGCKASDVIAVAA